MIYQFGSQFTFTNLVPGPRAADGAVELNPQIEFGLPAMSQDADAGGRTAILWEKGRVATEDVQEWTEPGFRYLDEAMKLYFGDIRIPVKDRTKFIKTRIAGSSKSIQVWAEDLKHGRVKLPIISISRTGHEYHVDKFSPPVLPMRLRYTNSQKTRVAKIYRPVPWLVNYTITIWAEHKWDVEHALYQILIRYNPLAEFRVSDGHIVGNVQLRYGSSSDTSDKESAAEQLAKVKYELTTTAEAWLSLPETIVPTVLSTQTALKMGSETIFANRLNPGA